jgi:hypothetical protein
MEIYAEGIGKLLLRMEIWRKFVGRSCEKSLIDFFGL